jgi:hypothetical protein
MRSNEGGVAIYGIIGILFASVRVAEKCFSQSETPAREACPNPRVRARPFIRIGKF